MTKCLLRHCRSLLIILALITSNISAQDKPTLAVLDLEGFGISDMELQALSNRLRTNMTQLGAYRIIERGLMLQIMMEQDFQLTGCTSDECAVEIGQLLGAQFMMAGTVGKVGSTWSIELRIVDVESGQSIKSTSYDTQGTVDIVLTEGMGAVARKISGVELAETSPTAGRVILRPGLLSIETSIPTSMIFVDNVDMGNARLDRIEVEPGVSHAITVIADRYMSLDTTVTLEAGENTRLTLVLNPLMGFLTLNGDDNGSVKVNNAKIGSTPVLKHPLQMGPYDLSITKVGYYPHESQMIIEYNHITTVDFMLTPKPRGRAVTYSAIIPGTGQLFFGQKKGWAYLVATVALVGLGYQVHTKWATENDAYLAILDEYNSTIDVDVANQLEVEVQDQFDVAYQLQTQRNIYFGLVGGVWAINLWDIAF